MTYADKWLPNLAAIAKEMEALRESSLATVRYELLSDSLIWSDELPIKTNLPTDCLRPVFRYRTSLILGAPDIAYQIFWAQAQKSFPNWIGFSSKRTSQDADLARLYDREKSRALRALP